ncbi:uncharacterized protein [Penaeus vannamei]|uniref:uncharacterized protein n=1 Tax=Penaeus vannamei TaxID=6689 RepID=UPI00387F584B
MLDSLTDPVLLWDTFKRETLDVAQKTIGVRPRAIHNFISQETLETTDACRAARMTGNRNSAQNSVTAVRLVSGQIVSDLVAVWERLAEYFEQLYQVDPPTVNLDAETVEIPLLDPPIIEDPSSLTEVRVAISKLKSGKIAGKGDRWDCSNHRGITLLSIPGKVLAHFLLKRSRDHLLRHQRLEQSGFTPGKSTIDHILALRVIVECRREFGRGQLAAHIDLRKAFGTVHRCGGGLSSFFPVSSGVRQGCVLAPTHFNSCMDWILGRANVQSIHERSQTILRQNLRKLSETFRGYGPLTLLMMLLFYLSLETLVLALDAFSNEAKPLGLEVSWTLVLGTC